MRSVSWLMVVLFLGHAVLSHGILVEMVLCFDAGDHFAVETVSSGEGCALGGHGDGDTLLSAALMASLLRAGHRSDASCRDIPLSDACFEIRTDERDPVSVSPSIPATLHLHRSGREPGEPLRLFPAPPSSGIPPAHLPVIQTTVLLI